MTTNGGSKWSSAGGGAIGSDDIYVVDALDANTAFVSTTPSSSTNIYRTTNGGSAWTNVYSLSGGFIDGIRMFDANNGIAVGDPVGGKWTVLSTANGGASWARISTEPSQVGSEAGWNNALSTIGTQNIWFGTNNARVYRSTDGGASWASSPVPFTNSVSVKFIDAMNGLAGSDSGSVARTTDGGLSWTTVSVGGSGFVAGFGGTGIDCFAAQGGSVYRSTDGGATWGNSFTGSIGSLNHLDVVSSGVNIYGWTISANGNIAAFSGTVSGVNSRTDVIPSAYVLSQNYPNPFNPQTRIEFAIPAASHVLLKVYNSLGEEVATLVDGFVNAGVHDIDWNGRNRFNAAVASGVYFYRLTAANFAETKKMLLVK